MTKNSIPDWFTSSQGEESVEGEEKSLLVRVETNFARIAGIWSTGNVNASKHFIPFRTVSLKSETLATGEVVDREIRIVPTAKYGYPTVQTQEVWYALQYLWFQNGCPDSGVIEFSRRQLIEDVLGKTYGRDTRRALDLNIMRLLSTLFEFDYVLYNKDKDTTESEVRKFHFISEETLTSKKKKNQFVRDTCSVTLHPIVVSNLKAGFYKPVILSVLANIKSDVARLLYGKIDFQFSHFDRYEITTKRFFEEHGIQGAECQFPSRRKRLLENAVKEILGKPTSRELTGGGRGDAIIADYEISKTADGKDYKLVVRSSKSTPIRVVEEQKGKVIPLRPAGSNQCGEGVTVPVQDNEDALELFRFFDQVFFDGSGVAPSEKELETSGELVKKYGIEKSKFLIESVHKKLKKEDYYPKSILGILRNIGEVESRKEFEKSQKEKDDKLRKRNENRRVQADKFRRQHEDRYHTFILELSEELKGLSPKDFALFDEEEARVVTSIQKSIDEAATALKRKLGMSELRVFHLPQSRVERVLKHFDGHPAVCFPSFWDWASKHFNQVKASI